MSIDYIENIDKLRAFALKNYEPMSQKKIYYFHGRNQVGEERIAEYFNSKGYAVVRPESLSLEEQLNILANCESFASPLGSISHNSVFLADNSKVVFMPRMARELNGYQTVLNQINNINVTYIDTDLSSFTVSNSAGPFCYIISKQLKKFFGDKDDDKYTDDDFSMFLAYCRHAITQGLNLNTAAIEYYGDVWNDFMSQLNQQKDLQAKFGIILK